tara:strand:+ start:1171 stop:1770 length:600 start_codon:yes stop_codon:yes gene_type:complete
MTSILTGDIINSRNVTPQLWMSPLKEVLNRFGSEPKHWEIYRGDSFQLEVTAEKALKAAILIKATIKLIKGIDVRLAIGIGEKSYSAEKITQSNGSAFINSGQCFEGLKKSILAIKSNYYDFDTEMNLLLDLAQLTMNNWTRKSSEIIKIAIENPKFTQKELARKVNKTQSTISESLKIAGYDEIMRMEKYYRKQILSL